MVREDIVTMSMKELKKLKVLHAVLDKRFTQKVAAVKEERVNGSLHICRDGVSLKYKLITNRPKKAAEPKPPRTPSSPPVPRRDHPWRRVGGLKSVEQKKITQLTK